MAPDPKLWQRLSLWLTFPLIVLNGWVALQVLQYFQPLASILMAASVIAFLLNYPVQALAARGVNRGNAVIFVFLLTVSVLVAVGVTLIPVLLEQLNEFAKRLPSWIESGNSQLLTLQAWADEQNLQLDLTGITSQLSGKFSGQLQSLTGKVLTFALDTLGSVVNLLLGLALMFYLLLRGNQIWSGIFQWFPLKIGSLIQTSLRQNILNYYIGQATLATLNGVTMTLAFFALEVPFGLLFGLGIGFMTLVPFGGATAVTVVTLLVTLENFWLGVKVLIATVIIDQIIGNVIAPRILGNLTGLNPAWILISLLVGVKVAGPLGLVVAVPVASSIKSTFDQLRSPKPESSEFEAVLPPAKVGG
ncbi:MAG: AI-2E family transporter [Pseudanabaenaceae cyanobacterium bins.68]|nr:AI-2E family transporter [Pseudanabaenaceae cyanobacterium bins.68]